MDFFDQCDAVIKTLPVVAPKLFKIRTKEQGLVNIVPNRMQLHYQQNRARREVNVKSRQLGFSTWKELEALLLLLTVEGFSGAIVAHKAEFAKRLLSIVWLAYRELPPEYKVPLVHETEEYLVTPPPADGGKGSRLYIGTAGDRDFGHGDTIHWLHLSEVARFPDAETLMEGVGEAVPRRGYICLESTPMGRDWFYDFYVAARTGQSEYKAHFYPWWWDEDYRDEEAAPVAAFTEEELSLIETARQQGFDLTGEHIAWRRKKMATLKERFARQYPEDPESCFLSLDTAPIFDYDLVKRLLAEAQARPVAEVRAVPGGQLTVWLKPVPGRAYNIGADCSAGLRHGDQAAAVVRDLKTGQHVATLTCLLPPHLFARELARLGEEYNHAQLAVESNAQGHAVLNTLIHQLHYDHLYHRTRWYDDDESLEPGWLTTARSKERLCSDFTQALESGDFRTWDLDLLGQTLNVLRDIDGQPYTAKNRRDDILMAAMICNTTSESAAAHAQMGQVSSYVRALL